MSAPLISVVLPTLNRADLLPRSIGSVLGQSYRNLELIVVDDGSTEDLAPVCRDFGDARLRMLRHERPRGPAAARNTGLRAARGELVAFQDSDDEWLVDRLADMVTEYRSAGNADLVICDFLRIGDASVRSYPRGFPTADGFLSHRQVLMHPGLFVHTQCWLGSRPVLAALGGFDEALFLWDDWEFLIRISRGHRVRYLPKPLVVSYHSEDSITRQSDRWHPSLRHILDKLRDELADFPREHAFLQRVLARHLFLTGHRSEGRRAAWQAINLRRGDWRSWAVLLAGLAGSGALARGLDAYASGRRRTSNAGNQ